MSDHPTNTSNNTPKAPSPRKRATGSRKPWPRGTIIILPKPVWDGLYPSYFYLQKSVRRDLGLMIKIPVFIKDPLVALENPTLGVQEIIVRLEENLGAGPTSSRIAVVDFNGDTQTLTNPIIWDDKEGWFRTPLEDSEWLPDATRLPADVADEEDPDQYRDTYQRFITKTVKNLFFHQLNAWAVVQRVLEFYEEPQALGRPIPWGFDGNRLLIVPHAGFGENAYYDQQSKSLQFYYYGDLQSPGYTCLSHDIIAHESGHAILDGVRPMYNKLSSVQTAAFHEFIADLTAILLALFNQDIRHFVAKTCKTLGEANVFADLAKEFAREVEGRDYLRTAFNDLTMKDVEKCLVPHTVSQVMTGAMWNILTKITEKHLEKNLKGQKVSTAQALWWAAERLRRVALQPLDLCPPCDIQLIDYARAVIRNDILVNPIDEQGYRPVILEIFHQRGLCPCAYQQGKPMPADCLFNSALEQDKLEFIYHDIEAVARARTAAYYFLSDNRKQLHIPQHQDVRVVDLYDANKLGASAERLPREVVLEYAWQEEVPLNNDPEKKLFFGEWDGKTVGLDCGGTLVFDGRGNLLSWFRKPGTEHLSPEDEQRIRLKEKPTIMEAGLLEDLIDGRQRKTAFISYIAENIKRGLIGTAQLENRFNENLKPIIAIVDGGVLRFETTHQMRRLDFNLEEEGWTIDY